MSEFFQNWNELSKLAQDEDFRKFIAHPKVQGLMKNDGFKQAVQEKNVFKLIANPEFNELLRDPEVRVVLEGMGKKYGKKT